MKTLIVGQEVHMTSGCYGEKGIVAKITPFHVDVLTTRTGMLLRFDINGKGLDGISPLENGTFECGPWYIDELVNSPLNDKAS
jgi:hypothetical protein